MAKYDTGGKKVINLYNQAWAKWVLQQQKLEHIVVEAELSGEFQFIARSNDSLLRVKGKLGPFLALTELQFAYDKTMPERLAAYKLLAHQKYGLKVFVTVVYFLPPPQDETVQTAYHDGFMGQVTHVDFQVIKLWELNAEQVVMYDNPMLLPFVPLMQGGATEQMVRQCAERIRREPEPQAAELEAILAIFAGYVLDAEVIKQILRWEMRLVQESPIIQELQKEWLEKGREEGREEGQEEGEYRATLKALHKILTIRFDMDLEAFDEQFEQLDLQSLEQLTEIALTMQTLAEFERVLVDLLSKLEVTPDGSGDN